MLYVDYILAKFGYVKIDPCTIRLCMYQETFFKNMLDNLAEEDKCHVQPYADNQIAITRHLRGHQSTVNFIQQ